MTCLCLCFARSGFFVGAYTDGAFGIPANKIKQMGPELLKGEVERIVNAYSMYASWYKEE